MTITRRHKLSPLQTMLSTFLYLTDLDPTIQQNHLIFEDNILTSTKMDLALYRELSETNNNNLKNLQKREYYLFKYLSLYNEANISNINYYKQKIDNLKNKSMSFEL